MKKNKDKVETTLSVQTRATNNYEVFGTALERGLYKNLRESVPLIDASINKTRRLLGGFEIKCRNKSTEKAINSFLKNIPVGLSSYGIDEFIGTYLEELITYGSAIGEMLINSGQLVALYNGNLSDIEIKEEKGLKLGFSLIAGGEKVKCKYPELILYSALNPEPGKIYGTSVLRGLPFVSEILLKIFKTIGINWERIGNIRFAVSCKQDGSAFSSDRAKQIATEWQKAMRSSEVRDFVSLGELSVKAIGGDINIMDSQVPVRQMLEQIVAKMGIPPFLLGLSWSSTERMSSQQADILTSELEAYRRLINPIINRIVGLWFRLKGIDESYEIHWEDITMQDELDHAQALYINAQRKELEKNMEEVNS